MLEALAKEKANKRRKEHRCWAGGNKSLVSYRWHSCVETPKNILTKKSMCVIQFHLIELPMNNELLQISKSISFTIAPQI